jgi:hypothetical protein
MKVFDLQCELHHVFEGWFGSEADYASQLERGLLTCPLCGSGTVSKMLSAPRLNLGGGAASPVDTSASSSSPASPSAAVTVAAGAEQALQAAWLQATRQIMAQTQDVGTHFAEEARKMHYGEIEARGIRGQASRQETEALLDEGIGVLPLALPAALKGPVQ